MELTPHHSRLPALNLALISLFSGCAATGDRQSNPKLDFSHLQETREVLTVALHREGQGHLTQSIRDWPFIDRTSRLIFNCLRAEDRSALVSVAVRASQVEYGTALLDCVLADLHDREEVLSTIKKYGIEVLWKRASPGIGREILIHALLFDAYETRIRALPTVTIGSSVGEALAFLKEAETALVSLLGLPERIGRGVGSQAAYRMQNAVAFNLSYLRVQQELIREVTGVDPSSAFVSFANEIREKLCTEVEFGLLFSHTIPSSELQRWRRLTPPGTSPEKFLDIKEEFSDSSLGSSNSKRTWRRSELERMRTVLHEGSRWLFPKSTVQGSRALWVVTRSGPSEEVLGLWSGGVVRIFDGATRVRVSAQAAEVVRVSELGTIFLHEVVHAIAGECQQFYPEFQSSGDWKEHSASRVEHSYPGELRVLLDSGRWVSMGRQLEDGKDTFFSHVPARSDEAGGRRRITVYESKYDPPVPPEFFHELGPAHLPVYCVLEVYRRKGDLHTLPEPFQDIVRTWIQKRPPSSFLGEVIGAPRSSTVSSRN